jgi:RNA binding exosome subunit
MIDLEKHEHTLRSFVEDEEVIKYAMERMDYGASKYELCIGPIDPDRDLLAEGREEFIDGLNRLIMHINKQAAYSPVMAQVIFEALSVIRGINLLK